LTTHLPLRTCTWTTYTYLHYTTHRTHHTCRLPFPHHTTTTTTPRPYRTTAPPRHMPLFATHTHAYLRLHRRTCRTHSCLPHTARHLPAPPPLPHTHTHAPLLYLPHFHHHYTDYTTATHYLPPHYHLIHCTTSHTAHFCYGKLTRFFAACALRSRTACDAHCRRYRRTASRNPCRRLPVTPPCTSVLFFCCAPPALLRRRMALFAALSRRGYMPLTCNAAVRSLVSFSLPLLRWIIRCLSTQHHYTISPPLSDSATQLYTSPARCTCFPACLHRGFSFVRHISHAHIAEQRLDRSASLAQLRLPRFHRFCRSAGWGAVDGPAAACACHIYASAPGWFAAPRGTTAALPPPPRCFLLRPDTPAGAADAFVHLPTGGNLFTSVPVLPLPAHHHSCLRILPTTCHGACYTAPAEVLQVTYQLPAAPRLSLLPACGVFCIHHISVALCLPYHFQLRLRSSPFLAAVLAWTAFTISGTGSTALLAPRLHHHHWSADTPRSSRGCCHRRNTCCACHLPARTKHRVSPARRLFLRCTCRFAHLAPHTSQPPYCPHHAYNYHPAAPHRSPPTHPDPPSNSTGLGVDGVMMGER